MAFKQLISGVLLMVLSSIYAKPTMDLCAGCTMVNGAGYNNHPTDCDKFVQCTFDARGTVYAEVMQCAFGTEWNLYLLTCVPAAEVACASDKCMGEPNGVVRAGVGNCRGFWSCDTGRSVAKCCPVGQNYNDTLGCVDNMVADECTDMCFNEVVLVPDVSATTTMKPCFKREAPSMPAVYEEEIAGWGWLLRPCPIGTVFNPVACECLLAVSPQSITPAVCQPEIFLPFTHDHFDHSGKGNYVKNENVQIENGVAKFNGVNSRLVIPRFTNLDSSSVVIKIKYSSNNEELVQSQALISNNDCGIEPAIKITENSKDVLFSVGTKLAVDIQTELTVPHAATGQRQTGVTEKDISYKFANGLLSGQVNNGNEVVKTAPGNLRKVHCAIHIGHAEDAKPFKGEIDEITLYLCDPSK